MKIIKDVIASYCRNLYGLGKYVLDVGTGSANMALTLGEMGIRCISIEKNSKAYEVAKKIVDKSQAIYKPFLIKMDAANMAFLDETFDCVIAYKSMHHIKEAKNALMEMLRVCKQGGTVIIIEHKKNIQNALDLLSVKRGERHPKNISIEEIYAEFSKIKGKTFITETKIGIICTLKKEENNKVTHLNLLSSCVKLGKVGNICYYYDPLIQQLSFSQSNEKISINVKRKDCEIPSIKSICLNLANKCNMNCSYCYASGGNYGQDEAAMSTGVAQKGIKWFSEYIKDNPHIILFGGEPLLNKGVIKDILSKSDKHVSYSINTNATLLEEEIVKLFIENNVKVSISIDGTRETHNKQRTMKNGTATYDSIVEKLRNLPEDTMKAIWARMTCTNKSLSIYADVISLLDLGFTKIDMSFVAGNRELSEDESIIDLWMKDIDKLAHLALDEWLNNGVLIYPFVKVFQSILRGQVAQQTCTAGRDMLCVQPNGNIVPCFKFSDVILGNLESGVELKKVTEFEKYKNDVRTLTCDECWAYHFCGGLCPKDLFTTINIQGYRCRLTQQVVRCSLLYFSDYYVNNPNIFQKWELQNEMYQWIISIKGEMKND